jgi:hypothetical protein
MDNQEKLATLAYPEIEGTFPNNYSSYLKTFFVFILFFTRVIFLTTAKMVPGVIWYFEPHGKLIPGSIYL